LILDMVRSVQRCGVINLQKRKRRSSLPERGKKIPAKNPHAKVL
jgi:hypothetical protein